MAPPDQRQGEELGLSRPLSLQGDHGTQLGQGQQAPGHPLLTHVGVVVSDAHRAVVTRSSDSEKRSNEKGF